MKPKLLIKIFLVFSFLLVLTNVSGNSEIIFIKLQKNNKIAYINDVPVELDVAPIEIPPGRIMVPIRFISESFGAKVFWDQKTETISIYMDSVLYYKNKSSILEEKLKTTEEENSNLKREIDELNNQKNDLILQNNMLKTKLSELEKENSDLKEQINALSKKLEEYQNKSSNVETGSEIFEKNKTKVVLIENYDSKGNLKGIGTGFLATENGKVITNFHVIEGAKYVIVKFIDGKNYKVDGLINYDVDRDIAILKLPIDSIEPVNLGDSDKIKVGDEIFVISNPLGLELTLTSGVISYVNRVIKGKTYIQYTAPTSPGSSGGPLFNKNGLVIGIVTAKIVSEGVEGINFAIPINDTKPLLGRDKYLSFIDLFSLTENSWELSDEKIREAINLGKRYYDDPFKLIEMYSLYSFSYSMIYSKTNITILTPYFWIAYNSANTMKSGKEMTITDAYKILDTFGNFLVIALTVYGDAYNFQKYYSVKLSFDDKIVSPFDFIINDELEKTIHYPKSPKYFTINFYYFLNKEIPRNSVIEILIFYKNDLQETKVVDLCKYP